MSSPAPTRRGVLTGAAALAAAGYAAPAPASAHGHGAHGHEHTARLTILGTTDLHGNVFNWDYYKNAEYDDAAHNDIGIAKVQTLIKAQRQRLKGQPLLMLDAGDTIQGTPLAYYYAKVEPITSGGIHPMAKAMNLIGYDAAALGNHEFNYGIPLLRKYESQLNFPLLGANAVDPATKRPVFPPYLVKRVRMPHGPDLKVGILGLTNPGIAIWDRDNVSGRIEFPGLVEQAKVFVPQLKRLGCDVVVVAAHSGATTSSSYGDALPYPENASSLVAEQVPGIDAILVGHAHVDIPQKLVTNTATGRDVLLCEPDYWGMRLAVMELDLVRPRTRRWPLPCAASTTRSSPTSTP
jgi:2',3'-cyclic-nucleotide 2'-phosphodiesterase/3'-nucleotidase